MFLLRSHESAVALHIAFPGSRLQPLQSANTFQVGNYFWSLPPEYQPEYGDYWLELKPGQNAVITVGITKAADKSAAAAVTDTYRLLKYLVGEAQRNHIWNYFFSSDHKVQAAIDDLWTGQKAIMPDWKIARTILNNPLLYQAELTWVIEIALYFNNWELLKEIRQFLQQEFANIKHHSRLLFLYNRLGRLTAADSAGQLATVKQLSAVDPFLGCLGNTAQMAAGCSELGEEQIIYREYFCGNGEEVTIAALLQNYWNRLSLPLFGCKLDRELKENPEKIILLYLLGLDYGLPLVNTLAAKISETVNVPLLRLFVLLQQQIQKKNAGNAEYYFKDGCRQNYSGKTLYLFDQSSLHINRYGKKFYVRYLSADYFCFRIDKRIKCHVDNSRQRIDIYADVSLYQQNTATDRRTEIQAGAYKISWPWLWPKAEVLCSDLRLRWIFKKRRFQITILSKNKMAELMIDGRSPAQR
jgi:hypothetical protein